MIITAGDNCTMYLLSSKSMTDLYLTLHINKAQRSLLQNGPNELLFSPHLQENPHIKR